MGRLGQSSSSCQRSTDSDLKPLEPCPRATQTQRAQSRLCSSVT
ncbi:rCG44140 [Rattus norvegicus]|uniref:RCG44140 n=1 Tax=Rattus norvegicus TaxID=10116 RepID=A6J7Q4_RAT|nr:rCG44140 [Rattus norvegicus]